MDEKALRTEVSSRPITEKQPTGRIIGIIKRNWRAYVVTSLRATRPDIILVLDMSATSIVLL